MVKVPVGVAYGSNVEEVRQMFVAAVKAQARECRRTRCDRPEEARKRGVRRVWRQLGQSVRDLLGARRGEIRNDRTGEGGYIQHAQRTPYRDSFPTARHTYY